MLSRRNKKKIIIALDKMLFFSIQKLIFSLFLHKNICCGYSLEVPHYVIVAQYDSGLLDLNVIFHEHGHTICIKSLIRRSLVRHF